MTESTRFDGRVAIVTGAGRGLGAEFAKLLGLAGAGVVVNDISGADEVVAQISALGGRAVASAESVSLPATGQHLVELALEHFGRIDAVINNAGVLVLKSFEETSAEELDLTLSVHLKGAWHITQAAWPHMRNQGYGRILMVSSINGVLLATADHCAYGAAKGALAGLARELAVEGAAHGIAVNTLLPGAATGMLDQNPSSSRAEIDLGADLVAPGACWLVHEDCDCTGRMFACSAGRLGEVFTAASEGYQGLVSELSLDAVRENWSLASRREPFCVPDSVAAYNQFRSEIYFRAGNTDPGTRSRRTTA